MTNPHNNPLEQMKNVTDEPNAEQNSQRVFGDPNYGYVPRSGSSTLQFGSHVTSGSQHSNLLFQQQQQPTHLFGFDHNPQPQQHQQLQQQHQHQQQHHQQQSQPQTGSPFIHQPLPSLFAPYQPPNPPPPPHLPYPQQEEYQQQHQQFSNSITFAMAPNNQMSFGTTSQQNASNTHQVTTAPFTSTSSAPVTFSDLASSSDYSSGVGLSAPPANKPNQNLMSSTLEEYGPPARRVISLKSASVTHMPQKQSTNPLTCTRTMPSSSIVSSFAKYVKPTETRTYIGFIPSTSRPATSKSAEPVAAQKPPERPLAYSPPPVSRKVSPPLDKITNPTSTTSADKPTTTRPTTTVPSVPTTAASAPISASAPTIRPTSTANKNVPPTVDLTRGSDGQLGKIPKINKPTSEANPEKYNEMSLISLKEKYRELEAKNSEVSSERDRIEKELNDLTRKSHGQNLELVPAFRQKKEEQRKCEANKNDVRAKLKKIEEVLESKFNHNIRAHKPQQAQIIRKRAKMSTATPPVASKPPVAASTRNLLSLNDSRNWCRSCDSWFDTFKEFCEHLHKSTHMRNARRTEFPWSRSREVLSQKKSYDMLKSICAKVSNEYRKEFSLKVYDKVMNPLLEDQKKVKELLIERERGKFDPQDPVMGMKGHEHLIPVMGFYCQLCDRTLPDMKSADQHMKTWDHNYRHAINVLTDEASEQTFRLKMERSYKKNYGYVNEGPEKSTSTSAEVNDDPPVQRTNEERPSVVKHAPVNQYKKPTSHIVDQHECIADKFVSKQIPANICKPARIHSDTESDIEDEPVKVVARPETSKAKPPSPKRNKVRPSVDILPLGEARGKPAALKRLKTQPVVKQRKAYISSSSSSDESSDEVQLARESLSCGDLSSPFPELEMSCTGNIHISALKDRRLRLPIKIVMKKENLDDWKGKLLDAATLQLRLNKLITKEEPKELSRRIQSKSKTKPVFFKPDGTEVPITFDDEDSEIEEKPDVQDLVTRVSKFIDSGDRQSEERKSETDEDDEETGKKPLGFLDDFFTEG